MEVRTKIANAIDTAGDRAKYDNEVKELLSQKPILAWILHDCVEEFAGMPMDEIGGCIIGSPKVNREPVDRDVKPHHD